MVHSQHANTFIEHRIDLFFAQMKLVFACILSVLLYLMCLQNIYFCYFESIKYKSFILFFV